MREFADDVAGACPVLLVGIGRRARPEAKAVMVLGDEHDVARAGIREMSAPLVWPPLFESFQERFAEVFVRRVAIDLGMVPGAVAFRHLDRIPIPFAIR